MASRESFKPEVIPKVDVAVKMCSKFGYSVFFNDIVLKNGGGERYRDFRIWLFGTLLPWPLTFGLENE